jgi:hypothetical protein
MWSLHDGYAMGICPVDLVSRAIPVEVVVLLTITTTEFGMHAWRLLGISIVTLISVLSLAAFRAPPAPPATSAAHLTARLSPRSMASTIAFVARAEQDRPAQCQTVPIPMRDPVTKQFVTFAHDGSYRFWMAAFACQAKAYPHLAVFAVVWLVANDQCQTVVLGKPYTATYTDADGQKETLTTTTGLTILRGDTIVSQSSAETDRLCPGQVLTLRSPLEDGASTYLALFSLALPTGGIVGSREY